MSGTETAGDLHLLRYLLNQYDRLLSIHAQINMDTPADRDLHARTLEAFRSAAEPVRLALASISLHHVESFYDGGTQSHGWQCFTCDQSQLHLKGWALADQGAEAHRKASAGTDQSRPEVTS